MLRRRIANGSVILPDRMVDDGAVLLCGERIEAVGPASEVPCPAGVESIDAAGGYIAPGFVDMHVHGGAGADFMDGTAEAFRTALRAHVRHGTTSLVATTTVARHDQILRVLELGRTAASRDGFGLWPDASAAPLPCRPAARTLGVHFYGPYFGRESVGCHPVEPLRPPDPAEFDAYLHYADVMLTATVAPELTGAESFARAAAARGVRLNIGHSDATFDEVAAAVRWGARHVDHLFCAMSDKTKLRRKQPYPMRGGVLEATLYFDELTTEVIADGKHLSPDLLQWALKVKGPDRLALVTDCNRALDMPDGRYVFGPLDSGAPFVRRDDVGIMPDGSGLASGCSGMDHMVRTFHEATGAPLPQVIRMATLTPARILGCDDRIGSLEPGKLADIVVLGRRLRIERVIVGARDL